MSILFWNVRGINRTPRVKDLLSIISLKKPSMICLIETKIKELNSHRIMAHIPSDWHHLNNYSNDPGGRILIFWDTNSWNCTLVHSSAQYITIEAINQGGLSCMVTFIYAYNLSSQRKALWNDLQTFSTTNSK